MSTMPRYIGKFDIVTTGLTEIPTRAEEIYVKLIYQDSVVRYFQTHEGYNPGQQIIRFYNPGRCLTDCCTRQGTADFDETDANIICLGKGNEWCITDISSILNDFNFRYTAGQERIDQRLVDVFLDQETARLSLDIDELTFRGDTAIASSNPEYCILHWYDGLIKQADQSTATVKLTIPPTANVYTMMMQIFQAVPVQARRYGTIGIFVGDDVAASFQAGLINMNMVNYNPGSVTNPYQELTLPGFGGVTIIPTPGLNGTGRIIATPLNNIHYFTNLANDRLTANFAYNEYHKRWFWDINFIYGVTFGIDEYVVIGTFDPAVLTNPAGFGVNITGPLGENGGVAVDSTIVAPLGTGGGVLTTDTPA